MKEVNLYTKDEIRDALTELITDNSSLRNLVRDNNYRINESQILIDSLEMSIAAMIEAKNYLITRQKEIMELNTHEELLNIMEKKIIEIHENRKL